MLTLSLESVFSKPPTEVITELATSISLSPTSFPMVQAAHPPSCLSFLIVLAAAGLQGASGLEHVCVDDLPRPARIITP